MKIIADTAHFGSPISPPTDAYSANSLDPNGVSAAANFELLISNVISLLTIVAGIFFLLYFVLGGVNWVNAAGDSGKIQKARDQMIQGVLGMVVIALSYGLAGILSTFLGIHLLNPGDAIIHITPFIIK